MSKPERDRDFERASREDIDRAIHDHVMRLCSREFDDDRTWHMLCPCKSTVALVCGRCRGTVMLAVSTRVEPCHHAYLKNMPPDAAPDDYMWTWVEPGDLGEGRP